jgi:hypothetical protein
MFFNKKINDLKVGHFYKIKTNIERFDKSIRGSGTFLSYLTIADFFLAEYSYYIEKLYTAEFVKYTNLISVRDYIMELPKVKEYSSREGAIVTPFLQLNKSSIPFYWPGTEPVIPTITSKPSKKPSEKPVAKVENVKE